MLTMVFNFGLWQGGWGGAPRVGGALHCHVHGSDARGRWPADVLPRVQRSNVGGYCAGRWEKTTFMQKYAPNRDFYGSIFHPTSLDLDRRVQDERYGGPIWVRNVFNYFRSFKYRYRLEIVNTFRVVWSERKTHGLWTFLKLDAENSRL